MRNRGIWIVVGIPAIIAFAFGIWVFYSMLVDVSKRSIGNGIYSNCVEGCQRTPYEIAPSREKSSVLFTGNHAFAGISTALFQ